MLKPHRSSAGHERPPGVRLTADAINQRLQTFRSDEPPRQRSATALIVAQTLGAVIEQARTQARLTQDEVAFRLHLDRSAIARWERGERIPTIVHLIAFGDLVNVSLVDLLRPVEVALRQQSFITTQEENDAADD